jgi:hypothetical protein
VSALTDGGAPKDCLDSSCSRSSGRVEVVVMDVVGGTAGAPGALGTACAKARRAVLSRLSILDVARDVALVETEGWMDTRPVSYGNKTA